MKTRLDQELVKRSLVPTRSQAESYIKLGQVKVNGVTINKTGHLVSQTDKIDLLATEQYVSRAALKLASVAQQFKLDFKAKVVLDVGSSTGGFTDYALQHGAKKVIAVDVGSDQMHHKLRTDRRVELHEQTDIRNVRRENGESRTKKIIGTQSSSFFILHSVPDIILVDVSFISVTKILASIKALCNPKTQLIVMVKPQFEVPSSSLKNRGVIKNERLRRQILKDFEIWVQNYFKVLDKADSTVSGEKGNVERFYLLQTLS